MVYLALYPRFYVSEQVSVKLNKPWQVSLQRDTQLDGSTRELRRCSIKQSAVAAQHLSNSVRSLTACGRGLDD